MKLVHLIERAAMLVSIQQIVQLTVAGLFLFFFTG